MNLVWTAPHPLTIDHGRDRFDSGEVSLDVWLKNQALKNQISGASRTFVITHASSNQVHGYYALAAGSVLRVDATNTLRCNMPEPIPVMVLARLAVDKFFQGQQLGGALLQDAFYRTIHVSEKISIRALLVHALHEKAKAFYEHYGFQSSPIHPMTLMLAIEPCKRSV